jgi:hypothetical protein
VQIFLFLDSKFCLLKIYKFDGGVGEIVYVFITQLYVHLSNRPTARPTFHSAAFSCH